MFHTVNLSKERSVIKSVLAHGLSISEEVLDSDRVGLMRILLNVEPKVK